MSVFGGRLISSYRLVSKENDTHYDLKNVKERWVGKFVKVCIRENFLYVLGSCSAVNHNRVVFESTCRTLGCVTDRKVRDTFNFTLEHPKAFEQLPDGKFVEDKSFQGPYIVDYENIDRYVEAVDPEDPVFNRSKEYTLAKFTPETCAQNKTDVCLADPIDLECFKEDEPVIFDKSTEYCFRPKSLAPLHFNPFNRYPIHPDDKKLIEEASLQVETTSQPAKSS